MTNHARFLIGILAVTNIASYISGRTILKQLETVMSEYTKLHKTAMYMVSVLEEQDIDLSEFDLIALKALREEDDA